MTFPRPPFGVTVLGGSGTSIRGTSGSEPRLIGDVPGNDWYPSWSPDGTQIVLSNKDTFTWSDGFTAEIGDFYIANTVTMFPEAEFRLEGDDEFQDSDRFFTVEQIKEALRYATPEQIAAFRERIARWSKKNDRDSVVTRVE